MPRVLIIDDDRIVCETISDLVQQSGYSASSAYTLESGLREAMEGNYDIVLLDVRMPDGNGIDALPEIRRSPSSPTVIILTGFGDPDGAELAIKNGAWDYIEKPSSEQDMILTLSRAIRHREETGAWRRFFAVKREGIIGSSRVMRSCLDMLAKAASSDASVLVIGETGTGKELLASAIHCNSSRAQKNLIVVDCTALPETLVESILFGYEKGAFTGAGTAQGGTIKQADGGTLFLDEVGELPLSIQKRFLRVLQNHRFRPLGSKREVTSDFRLVSATNRDLEKMAEEGLFRRDLLFRIRSMTIELPPLREHTEDIRELCLYHIDRICKHNGAGAKSLSPEFLEALEGYQWPGNVRELFNVLESALSIAHDEQVLLPQHLPVDLRAQMARKSVQAHAKTPAPMHIQDSVADDGPFPDWWEFRSAMEREYIRKLMSRTDGNIDDARRLSKLSRARLYQLLKKHEP